MADDPRDQGFQYGRGWGSDPPPPLYLNAVLICRKLSAEALALSCDAWALEMALKEVRIASNGAEKARALKNVANILNALDLPVGNRLTLRTGAN